MYVQTNRNLPFTNKKHRTHTNQPKYQSINHDKMVSCDKLSMINQPWSANHNQLTNETEQQNFKKNAYFSLTIIMHVLYCLIKINEFLLNLLCILIHDQPQSIRLHAPLPSTT